MTHDTPAAALAAMMTSLVTENGTWPWSAVGVRAFAAAILAALDGWTLVPVDGTTPVQDRLWEVTPLMAEIARLAHPTHPMKVPVRLLLTEWPPNDGVKPGNARFDEMLASVRREGIREPLTINLQWFVIDGIHRLNAARLSGIEHVEVRVWTGSEFIE